MMLIIRFVAFVKSRAVVGGKLLKVLHDIRDLVECCCPSPKSQQQSGRKQSGPDLKCYNYLSFDARAFSLIFHFL